jgi:predicted phosphodiesterase
MKLALLSDIHGNLSALQVVLADVRRRQVDAVLVLGDHLSGPLQAAETASLLMRLKATFLAGNHERQLLQAYALPLAQRNLTNSDGCAAAQITERHAKWLRAQPGTAHVFATDVLMVHGTPSTDLVYWLQTVVAGYGVDGSVGQRAASVAEMRERMGDLKANPLTRAYTKPGLIACGHSHVPRIVALDGHLIVNPGSVGLQAFWDDHGHEHVVENHNPLARYAIAQRTAKCWQAQLLALAYDHEPQAKLAASRGRLDWALALRTGRAVPGTLGLIQP